MKSTLLKPLLPLRDIVIFPSMVVPLFVGRDKSIKALQEVMKSDKSIVLVTQKNSEIDDPTGKDLYQYGCLSKVLQLLKLPDGTVKVLVEGEKRIKILKHNEVKENFLTCEVEIAEDKSNVKNEKTDYESLFSQANLESGEKIAKQCVACHSFDDSLKVKVGPPLWGVVNRNAASIAVALRLEARHSSS